MNEPVKIKKTFSQDMCGSPYLLFLIVIYVTFYLTGAVLIYKLVSVGPGLATGAFFVIPFCFSIEDIIAEIYGYKISRLLIWLLAVSLTAFTIITFIIIHLPSPAYWHLQSDYNAIFNPILRVVPSFLFGSILISQFINIFVITKSKILTRGRFFWLRSIFSTTIGGMIGAAVSIILAYGSNMPSITTEKILLTDYAFRFAYAALSGGPAWLLVLYLKKKENIDVYDTNTNFNPFKLSLK